MWVQNSSGSKTPKKTWFGSGYLCQLSADIEPEFQGRRLLGTVDIKTFPRFIGTIALGILDGHSTETALLKILNVVYENVDVKLSTVIVALDISAAFDMICHSKLLSCLQDEFVVEVVLFS